MRLVSLLGVVFLITGLLIKLFPPQKNAVYGYKSPMSLINKDTWKEGNRVASSIMIIVGVIFVLMSLINSLGNNCIDNNISPKLYSVLIICAITLLLLPTELHLIKLFNINGHRRERR